MTILTETQQAQQDRFTSGLIEMPGAIYAQVSFHERGEKIHTIHKTGECRHYVDGQMHWQKENVKLTIFSSGVVMPKKGGMGVYEFARFGS